MDDELPSGVWSLDPDTRTALRLDRVRRLMREADFVDAILEVEELLDEEPDNAEGLFLLGEALLELGEAPIALEAYQHHVSVTGGDARSLLGLAICRYETCDLPGAVEAAREAIRLDPGQAEAHYALGLALERLPNGRSEAVQAFAAARQLEPQAYPLPMELELKDWQHAIGEAVLRLPLPLQTFWDGVPIRLEDWPDLEELQRTDPPIPPGVAGLYEGVPPEGGDPNERPQAFRLFRRNLERAPHMEALIDQLTMALQAEALDWLGLADISELGLPHGGEPRADA